MLLKTNISETIENIIKAVIFTISIFVLVFTARYVLAD